MVGKTKRRGKETAVEEEQPEDGSIQPEMSHNPELSTKKIIQINEKSGDKQSSKDEGSVSRVDKNWGNFDLKKMEGMNCKLEFIEPAIVNDKALAKVSKDEFQEVIDYWRSSLICYILGANPPFYVVNGYLRRIWGQHGVDKVEDEFGIVQEQKVRCEWLPVQCSQCKGYGHETGNCRKVMAKHWLQKLTKTDGEASKENEKMTSKLSDMEVKGASDVDNNHIQAEKGSQ
ncbi:OLC1v1018821C1 [Oldenlandia corymbosa var. corymbosa]|uniref:OLC1v1018821C1 n=1 Tax=Oldenlandia corymbosa var. corymbosa TaxID=529605 RepID=A0AAV1ECH1_OLDCO|nr:OLC1v1018821C1 [Oldenlandia corymbosa var. corymbosa]